VFNCDTCPVQAAIEGLDGENLRAWRLMRTLATRFNVETQALPMVLMRLTGGDDAEEFADLMSRLAIIYDVQCPAKKVDA